MKLSQFAVCAIALVACSKLTEPPPPDPMALPSLTPKVNMAAVASASAPPAVPSPPKELKGEGKLEIVDVVVGKGDPVKLGDTVKVHYAGTLRDGKEFDSSKKHTPPDPFELELGKTSVIQGWTQGLVGMKTGGKRKLTIPPSLGYGASGRPPVIPPDSTLIFEIELLSRKPPKQPKP